MSKFPRTTDGPLAQPTRNANPCEEHAQEEPTVSRAAREIGRVLGRPVEFPPRPYRTFPWLPAWRAAVLAFLAVTALATVTQAVMIGHSKWQLGKVQERLERNYGDKP